MFADPLIDSTSAPHPSPKSHADVAVIGGGILGTAVARELLRRYPAKRVLLLEKEADVGCHQTSHNSGVIHAGIYYEPGSHMAQLCVDGARKMYDYCHVNSIPCERVGKLIVASCEQQRSVVEELFRRGNANGVEGLKLLSSPQEICNIEPLVRGVAALWSPNTGIADFAAVTRHMHRSMQALFCDRFSSVFHSEVHSVRVMDSGDRERVLIATKEPGQRGPLVTYTADHVIACGGLHNNRLAALSGDVVCREGPHVDRCLSFRGRYYQLKSTSEINIKTNVYPCPTGGGIPVGIHFTPTVDEVRGRAIIVGPGSAICSAPEGYSAATWDLQYLMDVLQSSAVWKFLLKNAQLGIDQLYADQSKARFLAEAQKLIPSVTVDDITDSFVGVMVAGVDRSGNWVSDLSADFMRPKSLKPNNTSTATASPSRPLFMNIRNAPSPCATASLSVAEAVVSSAAKVFEW